MAHALLDLDQIVLSWSASLMVDYRKSGKLAAAIAGAACLAFAGLAQAQTSNAGAIALVRANNQQVTSAIAGTRDSTGAPVATDGATEAGEDQSGFPNAGVGGAFDTLSGVGATGGAGGFGGSLNVVTQAGQAQASQTGGVQNNQTITGGGGASASPNGGVFNAVPSSQQR
ncbi:MAG TPA: hypothetical protein VN694_09335 [Caulobacteraceae bacterium]|nr:hypothetical protein [Caulobacteraceae bacterium]